MKVILTQLSYILKAPFRDTPLFRDTPVTWPPEVHKLVKLRTTLLHSHPATHI